MRRTLINGTALVSMDAQIGDLPKADILLEDGKIASVSSNIAAEDAELIDGSNMLALPGLINGHLHTWQTNLRGLAGNWTVAEYMQAMHRGLATLFRPEDIYISNLMGALNQINNGVTTLVDWCHNNPTPSHTDSAIKGLDDSGIRALFLHGSPKPNAKPGQKHFSEVPMPRHEIERLRKGRFASNDGLLTFGLAILGPYYSTYEVACEDMKLAREFDLLASMHAGGGTGLVPNGFERLLQDKLVDRHLNVVHGNDIAPDTVREMVYRGGTFTVTSEIELQMGYGDPLTGILHHEKAPISIGTDVEPAVGSDMFTCMRLTLQHERNRAIMEAVAKSGSRPQRAEITSRDALSWATIHGASIAGLADKTGSITPGKQADIVLLRTDTLNMTPMNDLVGCAVMQACTANVDTVIIGGRIAKQNGKLSVEGLPKKLAELQSSAERILSEFNKSANPRIQNEI